MFNSKMSLTSVEAETATGIHNRVEGHVFLQFGNFLEKFRSYAESLFEEVNGRYWHFNVAWLVP